MKKVLLFLILFPLTMLAAPVTEQAALQEAREFLAARGISLTGSPTAAPIRELRGGMTYSLPASGTPPIGGEADSVPLSAEAALPVPSGRRSAPYLGGEFRCYLFNLEDNGGYVIVSGDDRTEAIIGYADAGHIGDTIPDGLQFLLDGYAEEMETLLEGSGVERTLRSKSKEKSQGAGGHTPSPQAVPSPYLRGRVNSATGGCFTPTLGEQLRRTEAVRASVLPMIQTRWNQGTPYNNNCPKPNEQSEERCVTGCVATSMAQVMRFHHYPTAACSAIPGYTSTSTLSTPALVLTIDPFPATTFDWSNMTATYGTGSSDTEKAAVAKLMQYCGSAVQMMYNVNSTGGSGAYNASVGEALKDYFGYDAGAQRLDRKYYSYMDWLEIIYAELAAGRPVVYGGQSAGGGHSFICDGYDQDDYFHFNWGWGGTSDGYFRLSLLNPREQGIGGSSSMDGFNYGQEIVIGIQPGTNPSGKAYGLSLEKVTLAGNNLTLSLCSYKPGTNNYDVALEMISGSASSPQAGTVYYTWATQSQDMTFNSNKSFTFDLSSCPSGAADGTYRIRVICKPHEGSTWLDCQNCDGLPITATVTGGVMSFQVPAAVDYPTCSSLTMSGNKTVGYEQTVTATVTGGSTDYREGLYLFVNDKLVMAKQTDIPAGETVSVVFAYTPTTAGDDTLKLRRARSTSDTYVLRSTTETILASDASNTQELGVVPVFTNLNASGNLYGNGVRVTVTVTNPSTTNSFVGKMGCSVRMYDNANDDKDAYTDAVVHYQTLVIPKKVGEENSSIDVDFAYDNMSAGKYYALRIGYYQTVEENGKTKTQYTQGYLSETKTLMDEGYALYDASGAISIHQKAETINCGSAAVADLTGLTLADVTITPSSNPNCLYLLKSSDTGQNKVSGNVVYGGVAPTITLDDEYPFYVPSDFTATSVSYTRTFTTPAASTSGWNTICLPFAVSSVTCVDFASPVDWFRSSSDSGKNFWVREFTGDAAGEVYFDEAGVMLANTPYIIAVPGDTWGDSWRMTGRAVTFHGSSAQIAATDDFTISGNNFKFCGATVTSGLENVYVLNNEGSSFVLQASTSVSPFRAWFSGADINISSLPALSISSGTPTELDVPRAEEPVRMTGWYTIDGRRLAEAPTMRGFYIHNGQKCFIP